MRKYFVLTLLLLITAVKAFSQQQEPSIEFRTGLDIFKSDIPAAKASFLLAIKKDSTFHGSYHFLGVLYIAEKKLDSAIWCFKKAIAFNKPGVNIPKSASYSRLMGVYELKLDFANAYAIGLNAMKEFPDKRYLMVATRDACLWAYFINHNHLDPTYMWPDMKDEYIVKSIDEEYLIFRKIEVDGFDIQMQGQSLVYKDKHPYDVFNCILEQNKKPLKVYFKIDWDMAKFFGGDSGPAAQVAADIKVPVYERVGAFLVDDPKKDLADAIKKSQ